MKQLALRTFISTAAILIAQTATAAGMSMAAPRTCVLTQQQVAAELAADYTSFDQTMTGDGSWRPLVNEGCYEAAAGMISRYLEKNSGALSPEQIWTLDFHAGQTLAMGGRDADSISWFEKSRNPGSGREWLAYVDATLAFLKKNHESLLTARAAYLAATSANAPRLAVIDGFLACESKTYLEAMMCAPKKNGP